MNIVFSDVDGTFQSLGEPISPVNLEAINYLENRGDRFVFVTGRGIDMATSLLEEVGVDCDLIFGNGAGLKLKGQKPEYRNCLTFDHLSNILPILDELEILYFVHTDNETIIQTMDRYERNLDELSLSLAQLGDKHAEIMDFKRHYFAQECLQVPSVLEYFAQHKDKKIIKIELMEASDEKRDFIREKVSKQSVMAFSSFIKTLEIVNPLSSKGSAIQNYLSNFENYTSFGIGDGENDLSMFDTVDVSVTVADAAQTIKDQCDYVSLACNEGGVGHFILANCK